MTHFFEHSHPELEGTLISPISNELEIYTDDDVEYTTSAHAYIRSVCDCDGDGTGDASSENNWSPMVYNYAAPLDLDWDYFYTSQVCGELPSLLPSWSLSGGLGNETVEEWFEGDNYAPCTEEITYFIAVRSVDGVLIDFASSIVVYTPHYAVINPYDEIYYVEAEEGSYIVEDIADVGVSYFLIGTCNGQVSVEVLPHPEYGFEYPIGTHEVIVYVDNCDPERREEIPITLVVENPLSCEFPGDAQFTIENDEALFSWTEPSSSCNILSYEIKYDESAFDPYTEGILITSIDADLTTHTEAQVAYSSSAQAWIRSVCDCDENGEEDPIEGIEDWIQMTYDNRPPDIIKSIYSYGNEDDHYGSVIYLFPNPASSVLGIKADKSIKEVQLTDLTGKVIFREIIQANTAKIDVKYFAHGVYILKAMVGNEVLFSRLIID